MGNLWIDYGIESREKFLKTASSIFNTEDHKPRKCDVVVTHFDNRKITVPTFNFLSGVTSLLHNHNLLSEDNIIEAYDIMTGKINGRDFWDPETMQPLNMRPVPILIEKTSRLGEVTIGYLYQETVSILCAQPHNVPNPLNLFYDKTNLDRNGGLVLAPFIFVFGFLKKRFAGRIIFGEYWPTSLISILVRVNLVLIRLMTNKWNITRF